MAGRGAQTFNKRQKEQQRKEKAQEKLTKRLEKKRQGPQEQSDELPLSSAQELAALPDELRR
jgi:hypothetical protein